MAEKEDLSASTLALLQAKFRVHRDLTYRPRRRGTSPAGTGERVANDALPDYHGISRESSHVTRSVSELKIDGNNRMFLVDGGVWE